MKKTLYVTDLDGTLMRDDKSFSSETVNIINNLIGKDVLITYATSRSINSASVITKDINFQIPVITLNGTIIVNPLSKEQDIAMFSRETLEELYQRVKGFEIPVSVTSYTGGEEKKLYLAGRTNEGFDDYLESHAGDKRFCPVDTEEILYSGETCYFTFIADREELEPLYMQVKDGSRWVCNYQQDKYRKEYWLEISPVNATKAKAIQKLQKYYNCTHLVVFGDSLNDISMFNIADEAYATTNADERLKAIATGVIGSNNSGGVAEWLNINVK